MKNANEIHQNRHEYRIGTTSVAWPITTSSRAYDYYYYYSLRNSNLQKPTRNSELDKMEIYHRRSRYFTFTHCISRTATKRQAKIKLQAKFYDDRRFHFVQCKKYFSSPILNFCTNRRPCTAALQLYKVEFEYSLDFCHNVSFNSDSDDPTFSQQEQKKKKNKIIFFLSLAFVLRSLQPFIVGITMEAIYVFVKTTDTRWVTFSKQQRQQQHYGVQ